MSMKINPLYSNDAFQTYICKLAFTDFYFFLSQK